MRLKKNFAPKICRGKPALLLTAFVICALAGCAANERVFKKGDLTLSFRHKTTSSAELDDIEFSHPLKISRQTVARNMGALAYTQNALLGKGQLVFSARQAAENSEVLAKALKKASPDKLIFFELDSDRGTTSGELFASGDKLNWRFYSIHGVPYSKNRLKGWGSAWRLVPRAGQALYASKKLLGIKTWDNWIVTKLKLPEKKSRKKKRSKKRAAKTKITAPVETIPELEKKLKFLKQLEEKGLIDNKEYRRKRKSLLDQYL